MKNINKKLKNNFLFIIVLAIIFIFLTYSHIIFQEGNPFPFFKAMIKLNTSSSECVKIDIDNEKYLTKRSDGLEIIENKLSNEDYHFIQQLGSGYVFRNENFDILIVSRRLYSRFYYIWTIGKSNNFRESIEWNDYVNEEYGFRFSYPLFSISNYYWSNLNNDKRMLSDLLVPNKVFSKNNNFYLSQEYNFEINFKTNELVKIKNTFIPEYNEDKLVYPVPWHIVIFEVNNEKDLDEVIKKKLGMGCSFKEKKETNFPGNYRVEINGDGKDLGETLCPVNYASYIIYNPSTQKVAFWSLGQECNIGLGFMSENCFDFEISESFYFF